MPKLPVGHPTKDGDVASSVSALTKRSYRHTWSTSDVPMLAAASGQHRQNKWAGHVRDVDPGDRK